MRYDSLYGVFGIQNVAVEKAHVVADKLGGEAVDLKDVVFRLVPHGAGDADAFVMRGDDDLGSIVKLMHKAHGSLKQRFARNAYVVLFVPHEVVPAAALAVSHDDISHLIIPCSR